MKSMNVNNTTMNKIIRDKILKQTQIQFEAETFMHEKPESEDYMDVYAEPPRRK